MLRLTDLSIILVRESFNQLTSPLSTDRVHRLRARFSSEDRVNRFQCARVAYLVAMQLTLSSVYGEIPNASKTTDNYINKRLPYAFGARVNGKRGEGCFTEHRDRYVLSILRFPIFFPALARLHAG